ncbi:hypothetical protein ACMYSK_10060 [Klebsiella sp. I138]|uniref:hypothetical protein n=1 Tax=Klebsiella sp. I138 TaxID=2755385 RepID=UPI003DA7E49F
MAGQLPHGDVHVPAVTAVDTFDDISDARKQAIREAVMRDYFARIQAVNKEVEAMTVAQREMFHLSLAETLALLADGETTK